MHVNIASTMNDASFIDACSRRDGEQFPRHEYMLEREQVDRLCAENSRLRDELDQDDDEMKHLRRCIEELERELQEAKEAATRATTRTTEWPSLPTTTQGTTAVVPSSANPKPAISGPSLFKPAPPAKGKGREEPTPYTEAPPVGAYALLGGQYTVGAICLDGNLYYQ